jgi:hypothetical protein
VRYHKLLPAALFIIFAALFASPLPAQDNFIIITRDQVNIRTAPKISSTIICQCRKGDVFQLSAKEGTWFKISMFSGVYRYVHQSLAEVTAYDVQLPDLEFSLNRVYHASLETVMRSCRDAERRAFQEASIKYPHPEDRYKSIEYENLLNDRYTLEIFHYFRIQPANYTKISVEVIKQKLMK